MQKQNMVIQFIPFYIKNQARMYWGKSLDQCVSSFCFLNEAPKLSTVKSQSILHIDSSQKQSQLSQNSQNSKRTDRLSKALGQKRSLKKYSDVYKSPQLSSTNGNSHIFQTSELKVYQSPNKQYLMQSPKLNQQLTVLDSRNLYQIPKNDAAPRRQVQNRFSELAGRNGFPNQNYYEREVTGVKPECNYQNRVFFQNKPNKHGRSPEIVHISPPPNIRFNSNSQPGNNYTTFRGQHIEANFQNHYQRIEINSSKPQFQRPREFMKSPQSQNVIKKSNFPLVLTHFAGNQNRRYQKRRCQDMTKVKQQNNYQNYWNTSNQGQNLQPNFSELQLRNIPNGQFPTIRQENQFYQQSGSFNGQQRTRNQLTEKQVKINAKQRGVLPSAEQNINIQLYPSFCNRNLKILIANHQMQPLQAQSSQIRMNQSELNDFEVSCADLLFDQQSQNKQVINSQEQLIESNTESEYNVIFQRRPIHQPSIAFKVIQNKMKGHAYHQSRGSSNDVVSYHKTSQKSQNYHPMKAPQQNFRGIAQVNRTQSQHLKLRRVGLNINDNLINHQGTERPQERSLIGLLTQQKQNNQASQYLTNRTNQIWGQNRAVLNLKHNHNNHVPTNRKPSNHRASQQTATSHNNGIQTDRLRQSTLKKIQANDKKVKTLVNNNNRKATINSIIQEDCSFIRTSERQSYTIMSKYLSDDCIDQNMLSFAEGDRDQSTVIARHCFYKTLHKLV